MKVLMQQGLFQQGIKRGVARSSGLSNEDEGIQDDRTILSNEVCVEVGGRGGD